MIGMTIVVDLLRQSHDERHTALAFPRKSHFRRDLTSDESCTYTPTNCQNSSRIKQTSYYITDTSRQTGAAASL